MQQFADVIIDISHTRLDRPFTYKVPGPLTNRVGVGMRVRVPFRQHQEQGYVVALGDDAAVYNPREILSCLDDQPLFDANSLELAQWMAKRYLCPVVQAIECLFPAAVKHAGQRMVRLAGVDAAEIADAISSLATIDPSAARVLALLWEHGDMVRSEMGRRVRIRDLDHVINSLVERQLVEVDTVSKETAAGSLYPSPLVPGDSSACWGQNDNAAENGAGLDSLTAGGPLVLNPYQREAVTEIQQVLDRQEHQVFLLHGVTGSGKTEVYLRSIASLVEKGKGAIVLVPEIALTPQTVSRFRSRFGDLVAVLHSRQPAGTRLREWQRIRRGQAQVVIGPRSAVFAPVGRLGLIIVDEEHEASYKQEQNPRYHAREVAVQRAKLLGIPVILGSATPSLESYHRVARGEYRLQELPSRVEERPLPLVTIVDLREELKAGNKGVLSEILKEKISSRLAAREQVILFLNRRGFSTFVVCRDCGTVLNCPNCAIALTYHHQGNQMCCHYCGFRSGVPQTCSRCSGSRIRYFGIGTQRVEDEVRALYPGARMLRFDIDTTGRKGVLEEGLNSFARGDVDILVGTQMVAKGLDFPNVTLVGVITADTSLNLPDFRAAERTFQLLTQVAGRAGRGSITGEVIVQTYHPDHYPVVLAASQDFREFWHRESEFRQRLNYPPYCHLARILVVGAIERRVIQDAADLSQRLACEIKAQSTGIEMLGPAPAALARIKNRYRWHIVLKAPKVEALATVINRARAEFPGSSSLVVDIDPLGML